jgi:hypothetical protein
VINIASKDTLKNIPEGTPNVSWLTVDMISCILLIKSRQLVGMVLALWVRIVRIVECSGPKPDLTHPYTLYEREDRFHCREAQSPRFYGLH